MEHTITLGEITEASRTLSLAMKNRKGYTLIILMIAIFMMNIGLLVAIPVWKTQLQREKEEELIFRGKQYVEAIRLYQMKHPGTYPQSLEELLKEKCLRKLYKDPMNENGQWDIILPHTGKSEGKSSTSQEIFIAPQSALSSMEHPQIIGVVSSSSEKSIKIYLHQETYDHWLFFYGQGQNSMPEIIYYEKSKKD